MYIRRRALGSSQCTELYDMVAVEAVATDADRKHVYLPLNQFQANSQGHGMWWTRYLTVLPCYVSVLLTYSPAARGGNLEKIPPNQVIDDFGRGSSVESGYE